MALSVVGRITEFVNAARADSYDSRRFLLLLVVFFSTYGWFIDRFEALGPPFAASLVLGLGAALCLGALAGLAFAMLYEFVSRCAHRRRSN